LNDGKPLVAFKAGVPDEIAELLMMAPENFQRQSDPLFWLTDSPGAIAREINQLADCGRIDEASATLRRKHREIVGRLQEVSEQRQNAEREAAELEWVEEATQLFHRLDDLQGQRTSLEERGATLDHHIREIEEVDRILERGRRDSVPDLITELVSLRSKLQQLLPRIKEITELCQQLESLERLKRDMEKQRSALEKKLSGIKKCPLCQRNIDRWQ
jgi:DNA repair exonuclease SbcCD ATPase subunit